MKAIKKLTRTIRKWWMLITAPSNTVSYKGRYYMLAPEDNKKEVPAYAIKFSGILGWEYDLSSDSPLVIEFPTMQQARKRTILAKYYIEVME